jgi:arabinofuranosyltransferase
MVCDLAGRARREALVHGGWVLFGVGLIPGVYQVFRMGYFAAIVPNTAIAKEAGLADWQQGWLYFDDLVWTYHLWIPLTLVGMWWLAIMAGAIRRRSRAGLVAAVPVIAATLHALYVIRLGGDFMHGRFLLPTLFAVLLPLAAVPIQIPGPARMRSMAAELVTAPVLIWAIVCATFLGLPSDVMTSRFGVTDERKFYVD